MSKTKKTTTTTKAAPKPVADMTFDVVEEQPKTETNEENVTEPAPEATEEVKPTVEEVAPSTEKVEEVTEPTPEVKETDVTEDVTPADKPVETAPEETEEKPTEATPEVKEPAAEDNSVPNTESTEAPKDDQPESTENPVEPAPEAPKDDARELYNKLNKVYKSRISMSINTKMLAVRRNITIYNMIDLFIHNRTCFLGLTSVEDYKEVADVVSNNEIKISGNSVFSKEAKKQFLTRLENFTSFVQSHWA